MASAMVSWTVIASINVRGMVRDSLKSVGIERNTRLHQRIS